MFQEETIFDFVRTFFQYEMNPFIRDILLKIGKTEILTVKI